jgi:precorrin-6B C5,15-methyltransferase / cobalt-precorrin-6B C5,C15-methyltransferase
VKKIYIIGIGYKPLDRRAAEILSSADGIIASPRLLVVLKDYAIFSEVQEKVVVITKVEETMAFIRNNAGSKSLALIASGDPMFFGIGKMVVREFGRDRVEIIPDLSSIQVAFSRIGEHWDDAFLMSLHGGIDPGKRRRLPHDIGEVPSLLLRHKKIGILTDNTNNPAEIARHLLQVPSLASARVTVCERLGYPDEERITSGTPEDMAGRTFLAPNVVILLYGEEEPENSQDLIPSLGLGEGEIAHSRGLITKDEVRAVSLHKLRLPREGTLWDIGAGCGSVSIEAARMLPGLAVYAVEKDEEQLRNLRENLKRFMVTNVRITAGEAPEALADLPSPQRVLIGGSGGRLSAIIGCVHERMTRGILVINAVTLDTLNEATLLLEHRGFSTEIVQVSISRSRLLGGQKQLAPMNPVFVIRGQRA